MMLSTILLLVGGLTALTIGAEFLVRGSSRLAALARISPLVIGLTVVAFGTSAPELTVSVVSAFKGESQMALGNIVGSNIINVLFILGFSAIIVPLTVQSQLLRFDVPLVIGVSVLTWILGFDGRIGMIDGAIFVCGLFAYTVWSIRASRRESAEVQAEFADEYGDTKSGPGVFVSLLSTAAGLALLVFGSNWFVEGAIVVAEAIGMSKFVISLTIVAGGTSLPEAFTSVVAAIKGERDIAVGNIIGSNLFNILCVLGFSGLVSGAMGFGGIAVPEAALRFDLIVMICVAIACLPIFFTGHKISRWEGGLLFGYQIIYTTWLIVTETHSESLDRLRMAILFFAIPLTCIVLIVDFFRHARESESVG